MKDYSMQKSNDISPNVSSSNLEAFIEGLKSLAWIKHEETKGAH